MKTITLLGALLCTLTTFAQTVLTPQQIQQDYQIFKRILTQGHPSLYAYTSKQVWDDRFQRFETQEMKTLKTAEGLFKHLSELANQAKDGHCQVMHPKMAQVPSLFPLLLKIIGGKLYTDTDEFGIPIGAQVLSVNDIKYPELLQSLLKYAPSDGYNLIKKYRQIENEFGILFLYEFGYHKEFKVTYSTPSGKMKTRTVQSQSFQRIGQRFPQRNSWFRQYRPLFAKNKPKNPRWPYVYFIPSTKTAVLVVNSFGIDPQVFKSQLLGLQKQIRKKKAKNLIIDVRQNNGGYRANAITLFTYVAAEPFKQRISESVITKTLPESQYVMHAMSDYTKFVKMYFGPAKKQGQRWVLAVDRVEPRMRPQKKRFKGRVYVLIGGQTFSAGVAFALNAKNDERIKLIGEETGGGYYFHTGQYPVLYQLPHSKIMLRLSLVRVNKYVKDKTVAKGSGVLPDYPVELTRQDLIKSQDTQLNEALRQINKKSKKEK